MGNELNGIFIRACSLEQVWPAKIKKRKDSYDFFNRKIEKLNSFN